MSFEVQLPEVSCPSPSSFFPLYSLASPSPQSPSEREPDIVLIPSLHLRAIFYMLERIRTFLSNSIDSEVTIVIIRLPRRKS